MKKLCSNNKDESSTKFFWMTTIPLSPCLKNVLFKKDHCRGPKKKGLEVFFNELIKKLLVDDTYH